MVAAVVVAPLALVVVSVVAVAADSDPTLTPMSSPTPLLASPPEAPTSAAWQVPSLALAAPFKVNKRPEPHEIDVARGSRDVQRPGCATPVVLK